MRLTAIASVVLLAIAVFTPVIWSQDIAATRAELETHLTALENAANQSAINATKTKIDDLAKKFTTTALALQQDSGQLVLRDDYFVDKSTKAYAGGLTIRQSIDLKTPFTMVAVGMLSVASKPDKDPAVYLSDWINEEQKILERFNTLELITKDSQKLWAEFLKEWRTEAMRVDNSRFHDALVQAAYSLLRLSAGLEEEHVEVVRKKIAQGGGSSGSGNLSASSGSSAASLYPHMYHRHTRIMLRIQRTSARH